jgi:hypothetical protein
VLTVWLASALHAETFDLNDGTTITGDIILPATAEGLNFRIASGKYQRVPWTKFTQAALLELVRNPKLVPFVEPLIEPPEEERTRRTEIVIKPVERLQRPEKGSVFAALFHSNVGLAALLLIYVAGIYAAYEISVVRAYPALMVCGISAVVPVIGQIVFLCMPTRVADAKDEAAEEAAKKAAHMEVQARIAASAGAAGIRLAEQSNTFSEDTIPETQVFQRGKFTFNRRFFETKFTGFFGIVRRDTDKDMILIIKTARGEFLAQRITRITGNEMYLEVRRGSAAQEVVVPFADVQEVILKHKNAP